MVLSFSLQLEVVKSNPMGAFMLREFFLIPPLPSIAHRKDTRITKDAFMLYELFHIPLFHQCHIESTQEIKWFYIAH